MKKDWSKKKTYLKQTYLFNEVVDLFIIFSSSFSCSRTTYVSFICCFICLSICLFILQVVLSTLLSLLLIVYSGQFVCIAYYGSFIICKTSRANCLKGYRASFLRVLSTGPFHFLPSLRSNVWSRRAKRASSVSISKGGIEGQEEMKKADRID